MKQYLHGLLWLICCMFYAVDACSDVYKWTDKNGKIHYGDKRPATGAEDITAIVKKQNIDTSTQEHQKLENIFRKENAADRAYNAQQAMPDSAASYQAQRCAAAKDRLSKLERRVNFIDDDGKIIRTTEQERAARADEMRKVLAESCSP